MALRTIPSRGRDQSEPSHASTASKRLYEDCEGAVGVATLCGRLETRACSGLPHAGHPPAGANPGAPRSSRPPSVRTLPAACSTCSAPSALLHLLLTLTLPTLPCPARHACLPRRSHLVGMAPPQAGPSIRRRLAVAARGRWQRRLTTPRPGNRPCPPRGQPTTGGCCGRVPARTAPMLAPTTALSGRGGLTGGTSRRPCTLDIDGFQACNSASQPVPRTAFAWPPPEAQLQPVTRCPPGSCAAWPPAPARSACWRRPPCPASPRSD